ncbi:Uncharacterised protein [Pseudomonas fragi]|uniref:Uncharacterized protein n=1 Tax=Pseudomonas fragi TaxID=296 RepID=A0A449IF84_PSEFR|nr:Uncharacterised protein [Pseudomonas fragi]
MVNNNTSRNRKHSKNSSTADVGDTELQRPDQQHAAHETGFDLTPACERNKYQPRQYHTHQYRKVTVDVPRQILANQAE